MFDRFHIVRQEAALNLIPLMSLFVVLIPFLLLASASLYVGVIPTSLPAQTDAPSALAADSRSVTVNLLIDETGIELSASNAILDEVTLAGLSLTVPKGAKGYDLERLSKALYDIKLGYENSDTVIVRPGDDVEYQDVIRVLDVARERIFNPGSKDEVKVPLFPVVVMSRRG